MSKIEDGGTAFPTEYNDRGLTMRDYFAAAALPVALDNWKSFNAREGDDEVPSIDLIVSEAYDIADAMLAARKEVASE